jgi:biopolymer transport protein ExbB
MNDNVMRVLERLSALADAGGFVMWPLLIVGLLAWTLILLRIMTLRETLHAYGHGSIDRAPTTQHLSKELRLRLWKIALHRHGKVVDTLVAAAPLLGLLGTVSGMITTFDGLTSMSLFSESGGIAGGIAEALTTTQAGLLVAIPAFFTNRVVDRKITKLDQRLDGELLTAMGSNARCES